MGLLVETPSLVGSWTSISGTGAILIGFKGTRDFFNSTRIGKAVATHLSVIA